jgi:lysophospholipase L1-like esterase
MFQRSGYTISSRSAVLTVLIAAGFLIIAATGRRAETAQLRITAGWKFDFGPGAVANGYTRVTAQNTYTREAGYGFEPGPKMTCTDRGGKDVLRSDFCTSDQPFYFSVALPEGNYRVTVTLGDAAGESVTTVKAELRRLMIEKVETKRDRFERRTFTVNVRTPLIAGGGEVKLKDREKTTEIWNWDEKLTLEFNNARPAVCAIEITPANVPTIYLLGDSTVSDQPREPYNSWGQMLTRFFGAGVAIANHAESGESLRSSLAAKRLDKVLSTIKGGDYLFIQYGHNDEKEKGEGAGAFTTYKSDLKKFVTETRARGGIPVLITSVQRRSFDKDEKITNSHGDYPEAMRQVAREENAPLIDLNVMSKALYEAWEQNPRNALSHQTTTHITTTMAVTSWRNASSKVLDQTN